MKEVTATLPNADVTTCAFVRLVDQAIGCLACMGPVGIKDAPRQLPNVLLYIGALFRRQQITPDLRVKNISYVDWPGLKRRGFNAVVIDKDNCLTWPDRDELHPPLSAGWAHLKRTFGRDRVLVVSNSSGTKKDHGGLSAEAVSRQLGVPVLLHQRRKPGCAADVLAYFTGVLKPVATSHTPLPPRLELKGLEDVDMLIPSPKVKQRKITLSIDPPVQVMPEAPASKTDEPLRILVVGDRQFTDSLLAHRLSLHFPKPDLDSPRVISIHTTLLPNPSDVRALRWLENFLSSGIRRSQVDWGRYILSHEYGTEAVEPNVTPAAPTWWSRTKKVWAMTVAASRSTVAGVKWVIAKFRQKPAAASTSDLPPNSLPLDAPVDTRRAAKILTWLRSRLPGSKVITQE